MRKFLKKNRDLLLLIGLLMVGTLLAFLPSWLNGHYFVGGGDVKTQSFEFFILYKREIINALRNRTLPFWSWIVFLGNNIWSSKLFYGMFDIFNVVSYLLPFDYYVIYELQCLAKVLVAGISCYYLLSYLFKDKRWIFLGALSYGLSSYAIYFLSSPNLLTPYALMPLYFLGMEKYLKERKQLLFIIVSTILFYAQFYTFYAITLISPIYFIYRYYNIHQKIKGFFKEALPLIGGYLIAFLLAGVVLIPEVFYIIQNERVGNFNASLLFTDPVLFIHVLISWLVPSQDYIYNVNIFNDGSHALKELCVFSSSLIALALPLFVVNKDKFFRKSTTILYIIITLLILTPIGCSMMAGFSEVSFRWVLIVILLNIMTAVRCLEDNTKDNRKALITITISESALIVAGMAIALILRNGGFNDYLKQIVIFAIVILITGVLCFLLIYEKKKLITAVTVIELLMCSLIFGINVESNGETQEFIDKLSNVLTDNYDYHNLKYYLNSLEESNGSEFYRTYVDLDSLYWTYSRNFNIIYNLESVTTYDSAYEPGFNEIRDLYYGDIVGEIGWEYYIQEPNLLSYYSTKYSITATKEEIPFINYEIIEDTYRGSLVIARNLDYHGLGRTYTQVLSTYEFTEERAAESSLLLDYAVVDNPEEIKEYMKSDSVSEMYNIGYSTNWLYGYVDCDDDSFLVISVPYSKGWTVKVNGEETETYEVMGGVIGVPVYEGTNTIEMSFAPTGFKASALMSIAGFGLLVYTIVREKRKKNV